MKEREGGTHARGPKRRLWRKIHIGIDQETQEIRASEVTSRGIGDKLNFQCQTVNFVPLALRWKRRKSVRPFSGVSAISAARRHIFRKDCGIKL